MAWVRFVHLRDGFIYMSIERKAKPKSHDQSVKNLRILYHLLLPIRIFIVILLHNSGCPSSQTRAIQGLPK